MSIEFFVIYILPATTIFYLAWVIDHDRYIYEALGFVLLILFILALMMGMDYALGGKSVSQLINLPAIAFLYLIYACVGMQVSVISHRQKG